MEYFGTCHLIQESGHHNISYDQVLAVKPLLVYIGYKEGLEQKDVPKSFKVSLTAKNDWHGLIMKTWTGYQHPFQIDTALYNLPLEVEVKPLSRIYHYPLHGKVNFIRKFYNVLL